MIYIMNKEQQRINIAKLIFIRNNTHLIKEVFTNSEELSMILDYLETI